MCVLQSREEIRLDTGQTDLNNLSKSDSEFKNYNRLNPISAENLQFSIKVDDLKDLMQSKGTDAVEKLNTKFGSVQQLTQILKTNIQTGISEDENDLKKRVDLYGKNEIPAKPPKSIFRLAFEALHDTTLVLLMICSLISIGLSFYHPAAEEKDEEYLKIESKDLGNLEWVEGVSILIAVAVVVGVSAFNDWRKERQFRGLKDRIDSDNLTSVIRNGQIKQINIKKLVVGDICCIKYGDLIPADGIIVQASDLKIDESSLTGETDLIKKKPNESIIILSGTHVMEGSGQFLVLAVGINSQTGIIMSLLGATKEEDNKNDDKKNKKKKKKKEKKHRSVLQIKLGKLALQIGYGGMIAALLSFIILCVRMAIEEFAIKKKEWSNIYVKYIISYLIQGITVIVVAVPEGLPLAVTLALAFAVRRMTKDNNLVRHLDACETMGNATTICSDKTGTLTTNRMTVVQCWIGGKMYNTVPDKSEIESKLKNLINESISVNTSYTSMIEAAKQAGEMPKQIGNKTECGLLGLVNTLGGNYEQIRKDYPSENFVKVYTFNSAKKMMSTIIKSKNENCFRLYSKGASEILLSKCKYYIDSDSKLVKLDEDKKQDLISKILEPMAMNGLRTLCIAYKEFRSKENSYKEENVEFFKEEPDWNEEENVIHDLTCLCLVGIEDPVRPEVPDAIIKCQQSGVVVRMVTGDYINTATSIAMKCGIIKPGDDFLVLESSEFNKRIRDQNGEVKQELLDKVWPKLRVLARSSPQDKYILVNGIVESKLNKNREVVAVTGDGTNDGPALKRADVGFAMGIQGTDVAKEASDIILTDDNFSSIVKAMMWGRNVYDAIAKFLQYQLTANFAAGLFSVICAATIQAVPLKAVQMLWVNMVMDTLASLALATEPPTEDLLKRKPYGRNKSIISLTMLKSIILHTVYQLIILFALVWGIENWMDVDSIIKYEDITKLKEPSVHFTIIFNAFVLMTLFNELNARKIHNERNIFDGIQNNKIFLIIWLGCFGGQILIVNFGGVVFAVEPIEWDHWIWCLFFGFGSLLWGQLVITIPKSVVVKLLGFLVCCKRKNQNQNGTVKKNEQSELEIDKDRNLIKNSVWIRGSNRVLNDLNTVETFEINESNLSLENNVTENNQVSKHI